VKDWPPWDTTEKKLYLDYQRTYMPAGMVDAGIRKDLRLDAQTMASSGEKQ